MKTAIVYYSKHHGNTEKLLNAIAQKHDLTLFDVTKTTPTNLDAYDRIGFASGIYLSKFHRQVLTEADHLPQGKPVFFLYTYGTPGKHYLDAISAAVRRRNAEILGSYGCLGFDTFGPFKLVGGLAKGHPTADEIQGALKFYEALP
jgi:flavodoxin